VVFTTKNPPNKPTAREWPSSAFFEVVLPVELVYNQRYLAGSGHRVTGNVGRQNSIPTLARYSKVLILIVDIYTLSE
jgi:hypothetical protein